MPLVLEICQGTTCFVMGSSELMSIPEVMPASWQDRVEIKGTTCLDRCKNRYGKAPCVRLDGEIIESATRPGVLALMAKKLGDTAFQAPKE